MPNDFATRYEVDAIIKRIDQCFDALDRRLDDFINQLKDIRIDIKDLHSEMATHLRWNIKLGTFDNLDDAISARYAGEDKYYGQYAARYSRPSKPPTKDLFASPVKDLFAST